MEDKRLVNEYKSIFDSIHASVELTERIKSQKPRKKSSVKPYIAMISTVAAAVMVFAAVHGYDFGGNADGVISETTVSTQTPNGSDEMPTQSLPIQSQETAVTSQETDDKANMNKPSNAVTYGGVGENHTKQFDTASDVKTSGGGTGVTETDIAESDGMTATSERDVGSVQTAVADDIADTPAVASMTADVPIGARIAAEPAFVREIRTEEWEINRYYKYIGQDVGARLGGAEYVGSTLTFAVDDTGNPTDDTAVLTYACQNGGSINVTVSKNAFFTADKNGTVTENDGGMYAYKISDGVYYCVYAEGVGYDRLAEIIGGL